MHTALSGRNPGAREIKRVLMFPFLIRRHRKMPRSRPYHSRFTQCGAFYDFSPRCCLSARSSAIIIIIMRSHSLVASRGVNRRLKKSLHNATDGSWWCVNSFYFKIYTTWIYILIKSALPLRKLLQRLLSRPQFDLEVLANFTRLLNPPRHTCVELREAESSCAG